jgi:cyanophycinase-like exopeptidase
VTIVDGAGSDTDAWEVRSHEPIMVSNVVLHSLPAGYRFDLQRRVRVASPMLRSLDVDAIASS